MVKKMVWAVMALLAALALAGAGMNYLAPHATFHLLRDLGRSVAGLQVQHVDVQGQAYPYLAGGPDAPAGLPLVLVHGFTADKDTFVQVARYLTPQYRVYAPDLPGFGDAARNPTADYRYEAQVDNLHAFVGALGLPRFHLGGSSMGGGIAALYAAQYPQQVASLWLLDAAATREVTESALYKDFLATGKFGLLIESPQAHPKKMELLFGQPRFIPYAVHQTLGEKASADYPLHFKILQTLRSATPLEQRYSHLQTPTLIVTGTQDRVVPPAAADTLARVFVRSTTVRMDGVGHIPMVEVPRRTAADYLAFRAGLESAP